MNTSVRARQDARGFSFIELLVTIIIAGIAFAALVPLFVSAQQKGAGDQARNVALSLARDKMEKIRQLDYDQITENNLNNPDFSPTKNDVGVLVGQFGNEVEVSSGAGSRKYYVKYTVTSVPGKFGGSEAYKQVTVDAYWTGNPQPVKHAVLETSIYKQYQGSRINDLVVSTQVGNVDPNDPIRQFVIDNPVTFTAYVNDADASRTSKVTFVLYNNYNGQEIARLECPAAGSVAGTYTVTYPIVATGAQDGTYTVKATAINIRGYSVNTEERTFSVETGAPPTPVVSAVAYDKTIDLTWPNTSAGDVVRYDIYRSTDNTGTIYPSTRTASVPFTQGVTPYFHDTGLTNAPVPFYDHMDHAVYYRVEAVDSVGKVSVYAQVYGIPHVPMDVWPPAWDLNPPVFTGSVTTSSVPSLWVKLEWGSATDPTSPPVNPTSGMKWYRVYRSDDGGSTWQAIDNVAHVIGQATYGWTDSSPKPFKTYQYYVRAVDGDGNQSTPTPTLPFVTPNYLYNLATITNSANSTGYTVNVTYLDGTALDVWPIPGGIVNTTVPFTLAKSNGSWKDTKDIYLAVGFTYRISYQDKNGLWSSKSVFVPSATPSQVISIP